MKIFFTALLLVVCAVVCHGQQFNVLTDTVQWTASSLKDLQTDTVQNNVSRFITYGTGKIEWIQHQGAAQETIMTYTPDSTAGNWNGSSYFHVYCSKNGKPRTFQFTDQDGNRKVVVFFTSKDDNVRSFDFTISEAHKLTNQ